MPERVTIVGLVVVALAAWPMAANAQLHTFVEAVADLATIARQAEPARSTQRRVVADRMAAALKEWDRAIEALQDRADRERANASAQRIYRLHLELGVAYRTRGRSTDALREFDAAAALQPSSSDLQLLRGLTLEALGRSNDAGAAFRTAWALDARNAVKAYQVIQHTSSSATDRDRARAALSDAYRRFTPESTTPADLPFLILDAVSDNISRSPAIADAGTADAFALLTAHRYGEAVAALRQPESDLRAVDDESPLASFARGQQAEAANRVADARAAYQAALKGALTGRSVVLVAIARLAQVEGDLPGAIDALTRAARLDPNNSLVHKELAGAFSAYGHSDEAFCELVAALLIDPRDGHAHASIGQLFLETGRLDDAVEAFDRALAITPEHYEARYALATALQRLGRSADAQRELNRFERTRREKQDQRRREIAREVEREESVRGGTATQDGGR
jgi:tetratricopeptide (TPR) repeat protein